jgi:Flp pilus assembly protein TadG
MPQRPTMPQCSRLPRSPDRGERGAATAELAMVLPMLAAVALALVWLVSLGAAQVRTVDAARETARALARGDPEGEAVARGQQVAPEGSRVAVSRSDGDVTVTVTGKVPGPGGLGAFPGARLSATAVAATEDTPVAATAGALRAPAPLGASATRLSSAVPERDPGGTA